MLKNLIAKKLSKFKILKFTPRQLLSTLSIKIDSLSFSKIQTFKDS